MWLNCWCYKTIVLVLCIWKDSVLQTHNYLTYCGTHSLFFFFLSLRDSLCFSSRRFFSSAEVSVNVTVSCEEKLHKHLVEKTLHLIWFSILWLLKWPNQLVDLYASLLQLRIFTSFCWTCMKEEDWLDLNLPVSKYKDEYAIVKSMFNIIKVISKSLFRHIVFYSEFIFCF